MAERGDDAELEALVGLIRARYGARVTEAELAELRAGVAALEEMARALRAVRLANHEEPFPPFVPFRAEP